MQTASLGEKTIDGLRAVGKSWVWTIPAGALGNESPIRITSEEWFSPDLQVTVLSTVRNPISGDVTYRLEQISTVEPEAALFTVPADYITRDPMAPPSLQ